MLDWLAGGSEKNIKLVLDIGNPLAGRLLAYDAPKTRFTELAVGLCDLEKHSSSNTNPH